MEELPFIRDCFAYSFEFIGTKNVCKPNRRAEWNQFLENLRLLLDGIQIFYVKLKDPDDFEQKWDSMLFNDYFQQFKFDQFKNDIVNSRKLFYRVLIRYDYEMEKRLACNMSFDLHNVINIPTNVKRLSNSTNHE